MKFTKSFLRNVIRKIIEEQFTPFSSHHKFETTDNNCNVISAEILYYNLPGWDDDAPGGPPNQNWANYNNSTLFWDYMQQPNPGQWIKILENGTEKCIQYKGTVPPLTETGPHTLLSGNVTYLGNFIDCSTCQMSVATSDNCTFSDFDYTAFCGQQHLGPAPGKAHTWESFINNQWNSFDGGAGCYQLGAAMQWLEKSIEPTTNCPAILHGRHGGEKSNGVCWNLVQVKRKLAKVNWAHCLKTGPCAGGSQNGC
jgi:hypothetical protein